MHKNQSKSQDNQKNKKNNKQYKKWKYFMVYILFGGSGLIFKRISYRNRLKT